VNAPKPDRPRARFRLGREGVALPMALMGLLIVTLLVTAMLTSGATESTIGFAHRDATHAIYEAEAALEWYIASRATENKDIETGTFVRTLPSGVQARFTGTRLLAPTPPAGGRKTWLVTAEPLTRGGRSMGALVNTFHITATPKPAIVDAAFTHGFDIEVFPTKNEGTGTRMFGTPTPGLCSNTVQAPIMRRAKDAKYTNKMSKEVPNPFVGETWLEDSRTRAQLAADVLQGSPLSAMAAVADFRFGPLFGEPVWIAKSPIRATHAPLGSNPLNWGCPAGLGAGCEGVPGASDFWPVVAIDANGKIANFDGGVHGQGILIVVNGSAHIHPPFRWKGLILVEGTLEIHSGKEAGANHQTIIEGAAVALNTSGSLRINKHENSSVIRFNRCAIDAANASLSKFAHLQPGDHIAYKPYARFELTR
jgi:hypothetical protein